jgi:hypothetical protein
MIERLALETGERAACASSFVKPIRSAVECERRFETKAGRSRMAACGAKRPLATVANSQNERSEVFLRFLAQ